MESMDEASLLKFVLFNTRNSQVIVKFLVENYLKAKPKLLKDLTTLVFAKMVELENQANSLNEKIALLYENLNKTEVDTNVSDDNFSIEDYYVTSNDLNKINSTTVITRYEKIYFKNIKASLIHKLNIYSHEIKLLKQLQLLFFK